MGVVTKASTAGDQMSLIAIVEFMHPVHADNRRLVVPPDKLARLHGIKSASGPAVEHPDPVISRYKLQIGLVEVRPAGHDVLEHPVEVLGSGTPVEEVSMRKCRVLVVESAEVAVLFSGKSHI